MKLQDFVIRAEQLIKQADQVLGTEQRNDYGRWVDDELFTAFRASSLSFLKNLYRETHPFYQDFTGRCKHSDPSNTRAGRGIIVAVLDELKGGWLVSTKGLVSAEIFADFLEMAKYLLDQNYKDAAAVITGSVLEEHLRQLCLKHSIPTTFTKGGDIIPKKADMLNSELANAAAYNKLDQKNVTAWLDLRNKAAHGKYAEYTRPQVELMYQAVSDFMGRNAV